MSELSELPSEECSSSESVFVGYRQELVRNRKTKYNVNGRDIVIFYLNGNFHAMDQRCYRKYWKSALIFTQNLLDSHCSVALTIDRVNKTAMGIYWYSNVNGRRERVEWYGNPFERPGVRKPCFLSFHQVLKMIIGRHKNYVFHVNISLLKSIAQAGQYHSCFLKGCGGGVNILPSLPIDH